MSTYLKNMTGYKHNQLKSKSYDEIQEMFDKEMKRVNTFVDMNTELVKSSETRTEGSSKRAGDELESDNSKKQKIDEHNIDREDLETLWKLVKAKHGNTRPEDEYERVLWGDMKAKFCKDELGKRSKISALFNKLEKGGYFHDVKQDPQGRITYLFIAHPLSIKLAKVFSSIFVMDCTYKTNGFNMPLLDIIRVSCFNTSFYSGFAFLQKEDKDSYVWALSTFRKFLGDKNQPFVIITDRELALMNAIEEVFPSTTTLLCVWHINKNVFANYKTHFVIAKEFDIFKSNWNNLVYSTTKADYVKSLDEFELLYKDKKDAIKYIRDTWLQWKEKFVSAWKKNTYIWAIVPRLEPKLLSHVSHFALKEIRKQYEKSKSGSITPCTGHYTATMGLPCAHTIKDWNEVALLLELIHPHWRIDTMSMNHEDGL
ncbi:PKS-NRPS hybrid synthetase [Tanacetum coccineum]|uniref:PKS-NRPS hybrid synthetase n=1 Tax=Tanacetum coccineum TaxID=301880 RepID=A0ABQ5GVP2_9ASTR